MSYRGSPGAWSIADAVRRTGRGGRRARTVVRGTGRKRVRGWHPASHGVPPGAGAAADVPLRWRAGQSVLASGEVVWAAGADKGGEFGVRFTDMDPRASTRSRRSSGCRGEQTHGAVVPGSKVRLHIDGLASPMRAKIKDAHATAVTVGSDLGFLQVGRQLELEDAQSGAKRPASIARVDVAVDPASNVPQLVVTLRYADVARGARGRREPRRGASVRGRAACAPRRRPRVGRGGLAQMKGDRRAHVLAQLGPALESVAERAKTTVVLLAKRGPSAETTAPWGAVRRRRRPKGASTRADAACSAEARGRSSPEGRAAEAPFRTTRPRPPSRARSWSPPSSGALALKKAATTPTRQAQRRPSRSAAAANRRARSARARPSPRRPRRRPLCRHCRWRPPPAGHPRRRRRAVRHGVKSAHKKHVHVPPFGNGPVHHGNVLRLKMDGTIESLEGAQQPTGFTVKLPGRRSLEAAAPLARATRASRRSRSPTTRRAPSSRSPSRTGCPTTR